MYTSLQELFNTSKAKSILALFPREPSLQKELLNEKAPPVPKITDGDKFRTVKKKESDDDELLGIELSSDTESSSDSSTSSGNIL